MKFFLCLAIFLVLSLVGFSQKAPIKFGDIPMEDMKMTFYDKDSSAAAVILADYGVSTLVYHQGVGFSITFERLRRIKILKKEGYDFATMNIPLYHNSKDEEKIVGLKAVTYNLEGGKIVESKMKSDNIFRTKVDNNFNSVKFTLPNVKEGSVVEIAYTINSDFLFNFQNWDFQATVPVKWTEYRANIPEYFSYNKYMQGYVSLSINDSKRSSHLINIAYRGTQTFEEEKAGKTRSFENAEIRYEENNLRWAAQDVPAFKEEPFMGNYRDYISKINFELGFVKLPDQPIKQYMGTWEGLNKQFLDDDSFGGVVKSSDSLNERVEGLVRGVVDPKEIAARIYGYVKDNIEWDGTYRKFSDGSLKKVLEERKGSSAEINLMLVSMLQKAGLAADPVLVSTRNHGFVRISSPLSSQFNYVICSLRLGDQLSLLDATDRTLPMSILPKRCLNGSGFVVSSNNSGWVELKPSAKSRTAVFADLTVDGDGAMKGKVKFNRDGYDAQEMRTLYFSKGEDTYVKELAESHTWVVRKSEFENLNQLSAEVKESYELTIAEHAQRGGENIYFNPLIVLRIDENPFKAEKREYPVDFGSSIEKIYSCKITIPDAFSIDELPPSKIMVLPGNAARFSYSAVQVGNSISLTSNFQINKSLFLPSEYPSLREFYSRAIAKQAEQIVLKRK